jgi:hypothetical protein
LSFTHRLKYRYSTYIPHDDPQNPDIRQEKKDACCPKTWNEGTIPEELKLEPLLEPQCLSKNPKGQGRKAEKGTGEER